MFAWVIAGEATQLGRVRSNVANYWGRPCYLPTRRSHIVKVLSGLRPISFRPLTCCFLNPLVRGVHRFAAC